jgi:hypothetical protein
VSGTEVTARVLIFFGLPLLFLIVIVIAFIRGRSRRVSIPFLSSCVGSFALSAYVVFFSNSINEDLRNELGFMSVAAGLPAIMLLLHALFSNVRFLNATAIGCVGGCALLGYLLWFISAIVEDSTSFAFTLRRIPNARTVGGVLVSKAVDTAGAAWTTGGCFYHVCAPDESLIAVKLVRRDTGSADYFLYDSRSHVLVPLCDATAMKFPLLMPAGDRLIGLSELKNGLNIGNAGRIDYGGGELKVPEKWFRARDKGSSPK